MRKKYINEEKNNQVIDDMEFENDEQEVKENDAPKAKKRRKTFFRKPGKKAKKIFKVGVVVLGVAALGAIGMVCMNAAAGNKTPAGLPDNNDNEPEDDINDEIIGTDENPVEKADEKEVLEVVTD